MDVGPFRTGDDLLEFVGELLRADDEHLSARVRGTLLVEVASASRRPWVTRRACTSSALDLGHMGELFPTVSARIDEIVRGERGCSASARRAIEALGSGAAFLGWVVATCKLAYALTAREAAVLDARVRGGSLKCASTLLGLSEHTVAQRTTPVLRAMGIARFSTLPRAVATAVDRLRSTPRVDASA